MAESLGRQGLQKELDSLIQRYPTAEKLLLECFARGAGKAGKLELAGEVMQQCNLSGRMGVRYDVIGFRMRHRFSQYALFDSKLGDTPTADPEN